ncbi:MAG TPA: BON domain-containing protein [Acidimicrobiia bacterium]|nr:BON domain-containing protein [Acidimicrobiia bacterium]
MLGAALGAVAWSRPRLRRATRRAFRASGRRLRYARGRWQGLRYHLAGRHPADNVADDVLADRVRSSLGPIEKRLDMPRVHVSVFDRIAHLHGDAPSPDAHETLAAAVLRVPGIEGVHSFLHVGLLASDSRPSEGRTITEPSAVRRTLTDAARNAGAPDPARAVRSVLATFMARIPEPERRDIESHFPDDVKVLSAPPLRVGRRVHDIRELVDAVQGTGGLHGAADPTAVVENVVAALRDLVPEEAADVAAVLPAKLRRFWREAGV